MTDLQNMLKAVLLNPQDDVVRKAYADMVREGGDDARADFIEVQLALSDRAQVDPNLYHELVRTENLLLRGQYPFEQNNGMYHVCAWLFGWVIGGSQIWKDDGSVNIFPYASSEFSNYLGNLGRSINVLFRRGFVDVVKGDLALLMQRRCSDCNGLKPGYLVEGLPGNPLRSGSEQYSYAVVVSVNPFVLVSEQGDMLWSRKASYEVRRDRFHQIVLNSHPAFVRWEKHKNQYQTEGAGDECPKCQGVGSQKGILAQTLTEHPVSRVADTGRHVGIRVDHDGSDERHYVWLRGRSFHENLLNSLPEEIWDALQGGQVETRTTGDLRLYASEAEALQAYSDAVIHVAKQENLKEN